MLVSVARRQRNGIPESTWPPPGNSHSPAAPTVFPTPCAQRLLVLQSVILHSSEGGS